MWEASNALLDGPITNGDALMLAQVLEPGLDYERFDITPLLPIGLTPKRTTSRRSSAHEPPRPRPSNVLEGRHRGAPTVEAERELVQYAWRWS